MSENNQNLSELSTCKICMKYFLNPVILPCGNNVCDEHVMKNIKLNENTNKREYQCEICHSKHKVPMNGFIVNDLLIQMINNILNLDERTKLAKKTINDLDSLKKDIDLILKDPEDFIYSTFSKEKNKIDLKRETLILKIHDISNEMINKIEQMETESKSNLKKKQQILIDSNKFEINKLTEIVLAWNEEIRNPQLNKNRLEEIILESNSLLKQMENQSFDVKNAILSKKDCSFMPNNDEFKRDLFGELIIDDFSFSSTIVNSKKSVELIKLCEFDSKTEFKLLYRATRDGFLAKVFHSKCDKIKKTLTIIKVKCERTFSSKYTETIFGGYTEATWEGNGYKTDPNAFLFSLVNDDNEPIKMKIKINQSKYAIWANPLYGPVFGRKDLHYLPVYNNIIEFYNCELGNTYQHPNHQKDSNEAKRFFSGFHSETSEIEVYQII